MKLATKLKNGTRNVMNTVRGAFRGELKSVRSETGVQSMQIEGLSGETVQDAENYQQFGFTSNPPAGTKVVVLPLGGATSHGIIIATENASFRVAGLAGGEVAIYDQSGSTIILKQGKVIEIDCDEFKIKTKKYSCETETHEINASETITTTAGQTITTTAGQTINIEAKAAMTLKGMPSITLDTPMTILTGGLTAGSGSGMGRSAASYEAKFNIPVTFVKPQTFSATSAFNAQATFSVPLVAVDAIIDDVRHKDHIHQDSVGGKTKDPQNP